MKLAYKKTSKDLTQGNILFQIIAYAAPIFLGNIFQNLYNSVDSIVVGRFVGITALAAVSACTDISRLLVGFFSGWSVGSGVLFSKYYGAGDRPKLETAIHTSVLFAAVLGFLVSAVGFVAAPLLLRLIACPSDVLTEATAYLRIYLFGLLFTSIYNVGSGILRAVGDSKTPFYYLIISSVTNIILDLFFIAVLKMGVRGVAIATVAAQGLSVLLVFRKLLGTDDVYRLSLSKLRIDKTMLKLTLSYALPSAIQMSVISLSNMFVQRYRNAFGSVAMAGLGAARKITDFLAVISIALGAATTTFVSQNHGAKKDERAFAGIRMSILITMLMIIAVGLPVYLFAPTCVRLFISDEGAVAYGVAMIRTVIPFCILQPADNTLTGALRGFGFPRQTLYCAFFGMVGLRQLFLAVSMHICYLPIFLYLAVPVGWLGSGCMSLVFFYFKIYRPYQKTGAVPDRK